MMSSKFKDESDSDRLLRYLGCLQPFKKIRHLLDEFFSERVNRNTKVEIPLRFNIEDYDLFRALFRQIKKRPERGGYEEVVLDTLHDFSKRSLVLIKSELLSNRPSYSGRWAIVNGQISNGKRIAPVSSRISLDLENQLEWFARLRTLLVRLNSKSETLVIAEDSTTFRYARHLARLFELSVLEISKCKNAKRLGDILSAEDKAEEKSDVPKQTTVHVLVDSNRCALDELQISIADEIRCLKVSKSGLINRLLRMELGKHLGDADSRGDGRRKLIYVPIHDPKSKTSAEDLVELGAVGWYATSKKGQSGNDSSEHNRVPDYVETYGHRISSLKLSSAQALEMENEFLHHFTRPAYRGWIDQSESDYFDQLLLKDAVGNRTGLNHDALGTLCRILVSQRLLGNNSITRSRHSVCCFTEIPWSQFSAFRKFRSHVQRWDFMPYGISIRRNVFKELGGRPVLYGDEDSWQSIEDDERPFFQRSKRSGSPDAEDWTSEREWRILGDIDISRIDRNDIVAFVPDEKSLNDLAPFLGNIRVTIAS